MLPSTALILMLAAGGLMWLSLGMRETTFSINGRTYTSHFYGWPLGCSVINQTNQNVLYYVPMALDAGFALLSLFALATFCEWMIARKKR